VMTAALVLSVAVRFGPVMTAVSER
jgi:hypothetical protein